MFWQTYDWEKPLLARAHRARARDESPQVTLPEDEQLLEQAYAHCESVTALHSRSFSLASRLLPSGKRRAARALYAFCRTTDDIVDHPAGDAGTTLRQWRAQTLERHRPGDLVSIAWADTRRRYHVPLGYAEQFMEGVGQDLYKKRYATFKELAAYCYGVASTVGLMSMHIAGFHSEKAIPYAIKLGVALQLTNILRDVAEDWDRGRIYLPQEELDAFGITETAIATGQVDDRWRAFAQFQVDRARRLFAQASPGIVTLAAEARWAVAAAANFYFGVLDEIQARDFDVFSQRVRLGRWEHLRRLPGLWWRTRSSATSRPETLLTHLHSMASVDG